MLRALCHFAILLAGVAVLFAIPVRSIEAVRPVAIYDEQADARRDAERALGTAYADGKLVLLVFGANWCPDCRNFEAEMQTADLGTALALSYVVVKIDVAKFNKNVDLARKYGLNLRRGIPAAVVMRANGAPLDVVDGRQMADLRGDGQPAVVKFFDDLVTSARKSASAAR